MKKSLFIGFLAIGMFFTGCESMQKQVYDKKADMIGTNRTVTFYAWNGEEIESFSDKSMRFETSPDGKTISIWLGDENKKVFSNMFYIIKDN